MAHRYGENRTQNNNILTPEFMPQRNTRTWSSECVFSLELPHWDSSNEYPQSVFWKGNNKIMYCPVDPIFPDIEVGFPACSLQRFVKVICNMEMMTDECWICLYYISSHEASAPVSLKYVLYFQIPAQPYLLKFYWGLALWTTTVLDFSFYQYEIPYSIFPYWLQNI